MNKIFTNLFRSSIDPNELSLTIKGALVVVVPLAGLVLKAAGHEINNEDLENITKIAGDVVVAFGVFASSVMMLWGLIRKIIESFKS